MGGIEGEENIISMYYMENIFNKRNKMKKSEKGYDFIVNMYVDWSMLSNFRSTVM